MIGKMKVIMELEREIGWWLGMVVGNMWVSGKMEVIIEVEKKKGCC